MSKKNNRFIVVLLCAMILSLITGPIMLAHAKPPLRLAIKRQEFRNNYVQFENIIDALNVTDGMSILDIGSGPGYASFVFAEKLHGSGEVFATDIREDFVNYINDEAKRRSLSNLHSVLVKEDGLDQFYSKHWYDLVFMANTYHVIDNRIEYFTQLRKLLTPNARLVLVLYNQTPLFSIDDFSALDELINNLSMEDQDNPFNQYLSSSTRQLLKNKTDQNAIEHALVNDFNRMLLDPQFYEKFYRKSYLRMDNLTVSERDFANWLLMTLKENDVLEKPAEQIDAREMRTVIKLNRLFIRKQYGDYLANDGMGAYFPAGDANRHTSKYQMFRELNAAGYEMADEIKVSPFFDTVIMVPKTP